MVTTGQIEAAARWWTDKLVGGVSVMASPDERQAHPEIAAAEHMMAMNKPRISVEKAERFRVALIARLTSATAREIEHGLHVDYDCNAPLADALDAAAIDNVIGTLPVKTNMWFNEDGTVTTRCGYGAGVRVIYPAT